MRNKKNLYRLLKEYIKTSPRAKAQQRNGILPPQYRMSLNKLPTDQQYIKNFIVHIDCTYMYDYYGPPTVKQHKMYLHQKSFINPLNVGLVRRKAIEINDKNLDKKTVLFELIKLLNKDKNTLMRYTEIQQFLMNLSTRETKEYKKIVVYLYKWLLNQKYKFQVGSIPQQLCQETSELIIKKIYEAHEKGDNQLLKNTEEELHTIENLEKAREIKRNMNDARQSYELVYWAKWAEEIDRVEALQYILDKSKTEKDSIYLQKMIGKIRQASGIKSHQKLLKRGLIQISQLIAQSLVLKQNQVNKDENSFQEVFSTKESLIKEYSHNQEILHRNIKNKIQNSEISVQLKTINIDNEKNK